MAVLVGAAHGQFEAVALVFVLLALETFALGRRDVSALVGFYLFPAPGVLFPRPLEADAALAAGRLWVLGVAATFAASALWLAFLLPGASAGLRATTEAT